MPYVDKAEFDRTINDLRASMVMWNAISGNLGIICGYSGNVADIPDGWHVCVTGDTQVLLADGSTRTIREIVRNRESMEVVAFDDQAKELRTARILDWFENPAKKSDWVKIVISKGKGFGNRSLNCTKEHPIWTRRGWVGAGKLKSGDEIFRHELTLTECGRQALRGMALGDGSISNSLRFTYTHGEPQRVLVGHFADKFQVEVSTSRSSRGYNNGRNIYQAHLSLKTIDPDFATALMDKTSIRNLNSLGLIGLAYWYMDDGNLQTDHRYEGACQAQFHTEGFKAKEVDRIVEWFMSAYGIKAMPYKRNNTEGRFIRLDRRSSNLFFSLVAPFIHPIVKYKLPPQFRAIPYVGDSLIFMENNLVPFKINIRPLTSYAPSKRNRRLFSKRYDIKIDKHKSFIANGFLVHNCDGSNGTPDLRNKFIRGANAEPGNTGGANTHGHANHADHPALAHSGANVDPHTGANANGGDGAAITVFHDSADLFHTVTQPSNHAAQSHDAHSENNHLPPYYELLWIMWRPAV